MIEAEIGFGAIEARGDDAVLDRRARENSSNSLAIPGPSR
jgi:hypothetical protein